MKKERKSPVCGLTLNCGRHNCTRTCHPGAVCPSCEELYTADCFFFFAAELSAFGIISKGQVEKKEMTTTTTCQDLLRGLAAGELDVVITAMEKRRKDLLWERMPERIILLRHGESEGNVNHDIYTSKGDSLLELTDKGFAQARDAGQRLQKVIGTTGNVFVAVSPLERAQQTLYGLYDGGFPRSQVKTVHVDPRIREQEFGNFQNPGLTATVRAEEAVVGRFYYRRPNAESSADVYDRVSAFWDSLLSDGPTSLLMDRAHRYETVLLVTHGLTIRLLLMAVFQWSVHTFETVFNMGNCSHICLQKSRNEKGLISFKICPEESFPPEYPWATKEVLVRHRSMQADPDTLAKLERMKALRDSGVGVELKALMGESHEGSLDCAIERLEEAVAKQCSKKYTVVDYLTLAPPRTMQKEEATRRLVPGHALRMSKKAMLAAAKTTHVPYDDVESFDWWGDTVSFRGKALHMRMDCQSLVSVDLDVSAGGRPSSMTAPKCHEGDV